MGYVMAAQFKREKESDWEWGFSINEETIVDINGKIPTEVWDIRTEPHMGAFHLPKKDK